MSTEKQEKNLPTYLARDTRVSQAEIMGMIAAGMGGGLVASVVMSSGETLLLGTVTIAAGFLATFAAQRIPVGKAAPELAGK